MSLRRRAGACGVCVAVSAILLPAPRVPARAATGGRARNGLIVYAGYDASGVSQVFTIRPDGRMPTQLTFSSGDNYYPAWSADGKRIAFTSTRSGTPELWVMDGLGRAQKRITAPSPGGGFVPSWSPDGKHIAFSAITMDVLGPAHPHPEIWVVDADGADPRQLTHTLPGSSNAPSWSPDGSRIAFASDRGGVPEVYSMRPDGTDVRQLTGPTPPIYPSGNVPVWSPDGSRLAFWSGIEAFFGQVWVMAPDGTARRPLTDCAPPTNCDNPAWSPDGHLIMFETDRSGPVETWVMNADGTDQHRLLPFPYGAGRRPWQPVF